MPPLSRRGTPISGRSLQEEIQREVARVGALASRRAQGPANAATSPSPGMGSSGNAMASFGRIPTCEVARVPMTSTTPGVTSVPMPRTSSAMESFGRAPVTLQAASFVNSSSSSSRPSGLSDTDARQLALVHSTADQATSLAPALRKQAPPVNHTLRGDKKRGLEIAKDPDLLSEAVDIFKKQARSSGDTSHFNVRTWIDFHTSVACWPRYGLSPDCPALPLTPTKIVVVGSVFKGAGYRSTGNYLSAIKRSHIAHGHDWSPQLELAADMFKASTERGIGPGKQSCPLLWGKLTTADLRAPFAAERFPLRVDLCVVIWVFFFMRELEAATAELADMTLDTSTCRVKLVMSVSKNDPRALGCSREWGCVCEDSRRPNARTCPYHAAAELLHEVTDRFGQESRRPGFPLFPTSSGVAASAKVMLEVILVTAALLGEPLKNKYGQNRHGNHTWRALAAVLMAALGMDTNKIRMMGRWNCSIVLHYTRDAPLADMASDFKAARDQRRAPNQMKEMHTALKR